MEKKPKNKWLSFLADGMLSGLMIGIGCVVSMSCENRYLGAFLFSLGLFCIVQFQYGLYTGKVGYIFDRDKAYLGETFFTFLANAIGASLTAGIVHLTRFAADTPVNGMDVTLIDRAQATMSAKLDDSLLSSFVLAFFCGVLMFSAVEGSRRCNEKKNFIGGVFIVVMPIMVFILSGFNHCVADVFYLFHGWLPESAASAVLFPGGNSGQPVRRRVHSAAETPFPESAVKATPHKARLAALHAICLLIFRHTAQKSLDIRQYACGISVQSVEKSDYASYAQALCGIA